MTKTLGSSEPLVTGSRGAYKWLSSRHELKDLLRLCPSVVLEKYVAVTSIDSGYLHPIDVEKLAGWESRQGIGYSPLVQSVETLPRDRWDEWYVFAQPVDLGASRLGSNIFNPYLKPGEIGVFVNYCFALHLPEMKDLADLFWDQINRLQPESYISDNDYLTFVTRNDNLFAAVAKALRYPRLNIGARGRAFELRSIGQPRAAVPTCEPCPRAFSAWFPIK
jgi:hypothetical protein